MSMFNSICDSGVVLLEEVTYSKGSNQYSFYGYGMNFGKFRNEIQVKKEVYEEATKYSPFCKPERKAFLASFSGPMNPGWTRGYCEGTEPGRDFIISARSMQIIPCVPVIRESAKNHIERVVGPLSSAIAPKGYYTIEYGTGTHEQKPQDSHQEDLM